MEAVLAGLEAAQRPHVGGEVEQVEPVSVMRYWSAVPSSALDLGDVTEHALVLELVDHVVDDGLLPLGSSQVDTGQRVAGPNVRERLSRAQVQVLRAALLTVVAVLEGVEAGVVGISGRDKVGQVGAGGEAALGRAAGCTPRCR